MQSHWLCLQCSQRALNSSAEPTPPDCTMHDLQVQDIPKPDSSAATSEPVRLQSPVVEDAPLWGGPLPGPPADPVYRGVSQVAASPEAVSPHKVLHSFLKQSLSSCSGGTFIVTGAAYSGSAFWFWTSLALVLCLQSVQTSRCDSSPQLTSALRQLKHCTLAKWTMCKHLSRQVYPLFLTGFVLPCLIFNIYTCQLARPAALSCTRCAGLSNGGRFVTNDVTFELGNSCRPFRVLRITAADVQQHGSVFECLLPELAVAPGD